MALIFTPELQIDVEFAAKALFEAFNEDTRNEFKMGFYTGKFVAWKMSYKYEDGSDWVQTEPMSPNEDPVILVRIEDGEAVSTPEGIKYFEERSS